MISSLIALLEKMTYLRKLVDAFIEYQWTFWTKVAYSAICIAGALVALMLAKFGPCYESWYSIVMLFYLLYISIVTFFFVKIKK